MKVYLPSHYLGYFKDEFFVSSNVFSIIFCIQIHTTWKGKFRLIDLKKQTKAYISCCCLCQTLFISNFYRHKKYNNVEYMLMFSILVDISEGPGIIISCARNQDFGGFGSTVEILI